MQAATTREAGNVLAKWHIKNIDGYANRSKPQQIFPFLLERPIMQLLNPIHASVKTFARASATLHKSVFIACHVLLPNSPPRRTGLFTSSSSSPSPPSSSPSSSC